MDHRSKIKVKHKASRRKYRILCDLGVGKDFLDENTNHKEKTLIIG